VLFFNSVKMRLSGEIGNLFRQREGNTRRVSSFGRWPCIVFARIDPNLYLDDLNFIKWNPSASDARNVSGSRTASLIGGVVAGTGGIRSRPGNGVPSVSMFGKIRSVRMRRAGVGSGRRIWIGRLKCLLNRH
jgi:hypothetical protein